MASVNVKKGVGNRKTTAHVICRKLTEFVVDMRQFFSKADEQKKSETGILAIYEDIMHAIEEAGGVMLSIVSSYAELRAHNEMCRFGAAYVAEGEEAGTNSDASTPLMGNAIAELHKTFLHLQKRLCNRPQAEGLQSFISRAPRMKELLDQLHGHAIAWRNALCTYVQSPAFTVPFSQLDGNFDIFANEIKGTKSQVREYLGQFESYQAELAERQRDREFTLDEKKYDITGTRYVDASDSSDSDSDATVKSTDYDLPSDELDPDATDGSDTEEDSASDGEEDSAEVSQATGMFEANIDQANRAIVAEAEQTLVTRGERRLRSGGLRKQLDRLVPLLELAKTDENAAVRLEKRRRRAKQEREEAEDDDDDDDESNEQEQEEKRHRNASQEPDAEEGANEGSGEQGTNGGSGEEASQAEESQNPGSE